MANTNPYRPELEEIQESVDLHLERALDRLFNQTVRNQLHKEFTHEEDYEEAVKHLNMRRKEVRKILKGE